MPIDSQTTQSFIPSLLQFLELYNNCTTYGGNLKKSKFNMYFPLQPQPVQVYS